MIVMIHLLILAVVLASTMIQAQKCVKIALKTVMFVIRRALVLGVIPILFSFEETAFLWTRVISLLKTWIQV